MKRLVLPSAINGQVQAPPSKSMVIRLLAASLLARGESLILSPSFCADSLSALAVIKQLGAKVQMAPGQWLIRGGFPIESPSRSGMKPISCGESGLTVRLFAPIVALAGQRVKLEAEGTLRFRPMDMLVSPLSQLGVQCETHDGLPPLIIQGPLQSGSVSLEADRTSQFLSGLLMALPLVPGISEIRVSRLASRPYVELTIEVLEKFGIKIDASRDGSGQDYFFIPGGQRYRPGEYQVEGDWSGAAFLLVAGAIAGRVEVFGLNLDSKQADKRIIEALSLAGAKVSQKKGRVVVEKAALRAFDFDASDAPDLFPPLCVLAACCQGRSRLRGARRLVFKESPRAQTLTSELTKVGVKIFLEGDALIIEGAAVRGGSPDAHGDHRIAMACALAGLVSKEGIEINGWEAVNKSYPEFFNHLASLGGKWK
ncbi:MAG: 3-phosphoshikimate 1-carboxyvinyltransferase [Candidatus Aminicenantales bacterium]